MSVKVNQVNAHNRIFSISFFLKYFLPGKEGLQVRSPYDTVTNLTRTQVFYFLLPFFNEYNIYMKHNGTTRAAVLTRLLK